MTHRPLLSGLLSLLMALAACGQATAPTAPPTAAPTAAAPTRPAAPAATIAPAATTAPAAATPAAVATRPAAAAADKPAAGGELTFVVGAEPPSFDAHKETTFAMLHPTAPHYSLLVRFDAAQYPNKLVGDVAEDAWTISPDKLTYTFVIRPGVTFHDGSPLTARDVKASYDKIIFPPQGVISARKAAYSAVQSVEAPNDSTVVFKLKQPSAAFLANLASPWNFIYKADNLAKDPKWYEKNILGSGPFTFVEYAPGSHWVGKRYPAYFVKGKPYLDGFRAVFIRDTAAQVTAIRGGRAQIEFRGFSPPARDDLVRALGPGVTVQESSWLCNIYIAINTEKQPFGDPRVRRALTLALDRVEGSKALSQLTLLKDVGGLMRPGSAFAMPPAELATMPGFGADAAAARDEARKLLREANVPDGFAFTLKNRDVKEPYEAAGIFLIDQWRQIGLNVTQQVQESAAYLADLRNGNYEVSVDFNCDFFDEPDLQLVKFISASRSPINYGRYQDATLDDLYDRQSRESNPEERLKLIRQFERRVLAEQSYQFPLLWWQRIIPHAASVKGWPITPSHYLNQDLMDVWIAR